MTPLPPLCLKNATLIRPEGVGQGFLSLAGGRILDGTAGRAVDLSGFIVAPGIVDLHGDGFERHLAPRRGALSDPGAGLDALDAELAANGITTAVLAQFFSWEGGMRGPDFAEALAQALAKARPLTDMHLQLRLEVNLQAEYDRALRLIRAAGIGYVVFNDHLPHKALAAGKRPPRLTGQALKSGRSPQAHLAHLQDLHARRAEVPAALAALAATLRSEGVRMGSHDDPDPAVRAGFRAFGADIAEFPVTAEAARAARDAGDPVILGAPNVGRGGSHDGRVSARDLLARGIGDALVSDYHYPAPRQAAFALADAGTMPLHRAWALISAGPARVMGWADRGRLAPGARADLTILDATTRRVAATIAGGRIGFLRGDLAGRFLG